MPSFGERSADLRDRRKGGRVGRCGRGHIVDAASRAVFTQRCAHHQQAILLPPSFRHLRGRRRLLHLRPARARRRSASAQDCFSLAPLICYQCPSCADCTYTALRSCGCSRRSKRKRFGSPVSHPTPLLRSAPLLVKHSSHNHLMRCGSRSLTCAAFLLRQALYRQSH